MNVFVGTFECVTRVPQVRPPCVSVSFTLFLGRALTGCQFAYDTETHRMMNYTAVYLQFAAHE